MKKSKWFVTSSLILLFLACQSNAQKESSLAADTETMVKQSPLTEKINAFYTLFEEKPKGDLNCDELISKTGIGKEMVIEYVNADVREWSDEEWKETSYNAVFAIKTDNYYVFAIEREVPGSSSIFLNTYDLNGMRKSSIPICEESPGGEINSRIGEDLAIFRMDEYGVSTYKLNSRGVYVKGK